MSMDALALLNALDVIRNEGVYQKRLNDLAEAQAKLDTSEYIVDTVEIANARLDEANRLLEQHRKKISDAEVEIEQIKKERFAEVAELEATLNLRKTELDQRAAALSTQRQGLKQDQDELSKGQRALQLTSKEYEQRRAELNKREALLMDKFEQLRRIIAS